MLLESELGIIVLVNCDYSDNHQLIVGAAGRATGGCAGRGGEIRDWTGDYDAVFLGTTVIALVGGPEFLKIGETETASSIACRRWIARPRTGGRAKPLSERCFRPLHRRQVMQVVLTGIPRVNWIRFAGTETSKGPTRSSTPDTICDNGPFGPGLITFCGQSLQP